jgi:hypothetical protein
MVGPLGGGKYYCRGKEYGTCDRRSGTCFCEMGYQGIDCGECGPGHFKAGSLCYPKKLCAGDCGGHGSCNYTVGECVCNGGYWGDDCGKLNCKRFDALCDRCSNTTCTTCQVTGGKPGFSPLGAPRSRAGKALSEAPRFCLGLTALTSIGSAGRVQRAQGPVCDRVPALHPLRPALLRVQRPHVPG